MAPECLGAESAGTPDARTIYYNYPTSGDGAVLGHLDKSGDVSGLASGGTYEKIPEIGILFTEITARYWSRWGEIAVRQ